MPCSSPDAKSSSRMPTSLRFSALTARNVPVSGIVPLFVKAMRRVSGNGTSPSRRDDSAINGWDRARPLPTPLICICTAAPNWSSVSSAYGAARRNMSNRATGSAKLAALVSAAMCCARTSSGMGGCWSMSSVPSCVACTSAAPSIQPSTDVGNSAPFGIRPCTRPERPTRCKNVAMRFGDPS